MAKFLNRNLRIETGKKVIMGDSAESFLKYDGSDLLINVDSNNLLNIGNPATASDYNMVLTNAGNSGGALKIVLDGHAVDEDYNAIELSNVSTTPYDSYQYMNSMWIKTHIAGAALVGNAIDIYGADFVTWTNGTGFYNSIYGGSHVADVRTDATVDYITGHSSLARQQAACTKASSSLIANENLATVQGSGLIAEVKATHNFTSLDASAQATDVYGSWTQVGVDLGATVADIYLDRMQFTGTGGATGDIWGLYIEGAEKNYMQGELNVLPGGSTSAMEITAATQTIGIVADTSIILNQAADSIVLEGANATIATFDPDGLTLASGASVNEFSIDGTLVGDSDDAVPTEKAVKTYVDNAIGGSVDHNSTTGLQGGDSTTSEFYHLTQDIHDGLYSGSPIIGMGAVAGTNMEVDYGAHVVSVDVNGSEVLNLTAATQTIGIAADTSIVLNQAADSIVLEGANSTIATFDPDGLTLASGASVNEFSTDGTLGGDTDDAVPTEKAVKLYVDTEIANIATDQIISSDSYVKVVDDGTAAGYIEVVADGVQVQYWDAQAATIRMGKESAAGRVVVNDTEVILSVGSLEYVKVDASSQVFGTLQGGGRFTTNSSNAFIHAGSLLDTELIFTATDTSQTLGVSGNTTFNLNQSTGTAIISTPGGTMLSVDGNVQRLGGSTDTFLSLTQNTNTVDLRAGNVSVLNATDTAQTFGVSGDTNIALNQTNNTLDGVVANTNVLHLDDDGDHRLGAAGDNAKLILDQSNTKATLYASNAFYLEVEAGGGGGGTLRYFDNSTEIISASETDIYLGDNGFVASGTRYYASLDNNYLQLDAAGFRTRIDSTGLILDRSGTGTYTKPINQLLNTVDGDAIDAASTDTQIASAKLIYNTIGNITPNEITQGDSYVRVTDSTDESRVDVVIDGVNQLLIEGSGTTVTDDLTVNGDLFVDGTTWVVHNQEVTTSDNIIVVNNGETGPGVTAGSAGMEVDRGTETNYQFLFVEASDTFRIGEIGSLQAVATREDSPTDLRVPWWNDTNKKFETLGGTFITINDSGDTIAASINDVQKLSITASSMQLGDTASGEYILVNGGAGNLQFYTVGKQLELDSNGMTLASGASVNEFSTDGTLAGDSDDAVPTEKAVKTYVDTEIANISTDQITAGDSYVKVTDDGTDVGWIEIVADGVQVAYFDPSAATQRIGKASSAGKVEVTDTAVELYYAGAKAMYTHVDGITVRDTNSTGPKLIFEDQNDITMGQIDCLANIIEMKVGSSLETVFKATINAAAELYYDNVKVFETTSDGIKLNLGAATINEFSTDGTLAGDSDTAVPTEKAVKLYVDTKVGTEVYSGIADIVNGDTTATVIFDTAQADADYTITTHIVNTTDLSPSLYVHMTTEYDENGFTEVFSGPMDSGNYKLHFVITRADQGV